MTPYYLTKSQNHDMMRFFQADSTSRHANSMKKPHHIVILRFSELVKGHANYVQHISFNLYHMILLHTYVPYSSQQKAKN